MIRQLSSFIVFILLAVASSVGAAELKVGYVQVDKILKQAPQTAESGKKLEKEFSPRSIELDKLKKKIQSLETALDREGAVFTAKERRKKEREITTFKTEFRRKQLELREDINLRKNEELAVLQDRINAAVRTVAETEKFDLVVYGGVAYASKKIDITDKVLTHLGKKQ